MKQYFVVGLLLYFVVELLLLKIMFEVLVYYFVSLLSLLNLMERMGSDLRMKSPVCLYLNLNMRHILVIVEMNRLN